MPFTRAPGRARSYGLQSRVLPCGRAAAFDVVVSLAVVPLAAMLTRRTQSTRFCIAVVVSGALSGIAIEAWAVRAGRWSYTEAMPLSPILSVGVVPVAQVALLPAFAAALAFRPRPRNGAIPLAAANRVEHPVAVTGVERPPC